jgi:hypothetical protein
MIVPINRTYRAWFDSKTVSIFNLEVGPDFKWQQGEPYVIRIYDEDDKGQKVLHWQGTLVKGEFKADVPMSNTTAR